MFDYIFQTRLITLVVALGITWVSFILIGSPRFWLRGILFSYGPAFACSFFIVGFFYTGQVSKFDLIAGIVFEFTILMISTILFCNVFKWIRNGLNVNLQIWLRWSIVLQLMAAAPLVLIEGAGIFSEGSRINYFHESSVARYLSYMGVLTAYVQAALLAKRLSSKCSMDYIGYIIIFLTFFISIFSGSKGGGVLWIVAMLSLVDYRLMKFRLLPILGVLIVAMSALWITASIISESLGVSEIDFAEIAVARFFLNNDARALAIDFGGQAASFADFAAASFRSLANFLGYPSNDPPLGLLLNEMQTGLSTGNGPNASLIALILYYSTTGYTLLPALVACIGVILIYFSLVFVRQHFKSEIVKIAISMIGIVIIQLFSQDFLALPLAIASAIVAVLLFFFIDNKYAYVSFRYIAPK